MKLISEHIEDVEYITEQKDNGEKTYKIKGRSFNIRPRLFWGGL